MKKRSGINCGNATTRKFRSTSSTSAWFTIASSSRNRRRRHKSRSENDPHGARLRNGPGHRARRAEQNPEHRRRGRSRRAAGLGPAMEPEHDQRSRADEARNGLSVFRFRAPEAPRPTQRRYASGNFFLDPLACFATFKKIATIEKPNMKHAHFFSFFISSASAPVSKAPPRPTTPRSTIIGPEPRGRHHSSVSSTLSASDPSVLKSIQFSDRAQARLGHRPLSGTLSRTTYLTERGYLVPPSTGEIFPPSLRALRRNFTNSVTLTYRFSRWFLQAG